jgi:hypothetical protein
MSALCVSVEFSDWLVCMFNPVFFVINEMAEVFDVVNFKID